MALTDREILKLAQAGQVGSSGMAADPKVAVNALNTKYYQFLVQDAATAGTAVTETAMQMPVRGKVIGVSMTAPIAVTASDTNFATVSVAKRTGSAASAPIASQATKVTAGTGSLVAFVPAQLPSSAFTVANQQMAAGDVLTLAIAKAASGVALTAATSYFCVTVAVEEN